MKNSTVLLALTSSLGLLAGGGLAGCDDEPVPGMDAGDPVDAGADAEVLDPTQIVVRYDPDGAGFFRVPWPSDARRAADGSLDLSDFPGRARLLDETLSEIEATTRGFATMPVVYLGLSAPVAAGSLPQGTDALAATSPIQLLDLSEEGCGQRLPLEIELAATVDSIRNPNVLQVANAIGTVLTPDRPYGLIVLRTFGAEESRSTPRPERFDAALRDEAGTDALSRSLAPLRRCLPSTDVALDDVAVATVFTPQDPVRETRALRDYVTDPAQVETRDVTEWRASEGWSRRRLALATYTGVVQMPIFQAGETPYDNEGGGLVFDADGQPVIQRWESVEVAVAYQTFETPPAGPRPVLVFSDGTGWEPWNHLGDNWIRELLAEGYVVMSFMPQFHGGRAGFDGNTEISTFNIPNPPAGRSNFRQQAAETSYFVRLVRDEIAGLPGLPELDTERLVYGGHSQGALVGALVAAVEDQFRGYVFNGLSSFLTLTILFRDDLLDFDAIVSVLYGFTGTLDRFHPLLQMLQLGAEVVDPHNYVRQWHGSASDPSGNHVFVSNGFEDTTTTPRGMEHMTMSADMQPIAPPGWEVDPVGVWDGVPVSLPVQGNATSRSDAPLTIATYLDATQGHGTIYRRPFVRELASSFFRTARAGVPQLASAAEYQCADGADEDLDGLLDCADPDCVDTPPCVEGACEGGLDEDDNGLVDCADPVCLADEACQEQECGDGLDDDGDGAIDCADGDCARSTPCVELTCADGLDEDGDGAIDCADSDCAAGAECNERRCAGGVDEDRDGAIDCADSDCLGSVDCPEALCDDALDDDADGLADCADPDCADAAACERALETSCGDALDDDGDGAIDCADADCALHAACAAMTCADGDLGRQVGVALFRGTLEGRTNGYPPGDCTGLGAGGDAPDVALSWTAPAAGEYVFSTFGSAVDTILSVLDASCDPTLELACDDDDGALPSSRATLTLEADQTVVVVIGAYDPDEDAGAVVLHIHPSPL